MTPNVSPRVIRQFGHMKEYALNDIDPPQKFMFLQTIINCDEALDRLDWNIINAAAHALT